MLFHSNHPFWKTRQPASIEKLRECAKHVDKAIKADMVRPVGSSQSKRMTYKIFDVGGGCKIYVIFLDGKYQHVACFEDSKGSKSYFGHPSYPYFEAQWGLKTYFKFYDIIYGVS
jgi:hypothetical protein